MLFVSSFKGNDGRKSHKQYHFSTVEMKDYNAMIDERNLFYQPIKNDLKHLITLERLQLVNVIITLQDVY